MEKAFDQDMVFEWEFLHPKDSFAVEQERDLSCFTPQPPGIDQGREPDDESVEEEVYHEHILLFSDDELSEVVSLEKEIALEEVEEDDSDLELPNLLFNEEDEEEDEVSMISECIHPEIEVEDGCKAFQLRKWLKSALMAAATLSIFMLGSRRAQFMGNSQRIQLAICKKEVSLKSNAIFREIRPHEYQIGIRHL
ncbi:hypothetical protein KSP40_PGU020096 [Platanthera guangdongensis]|uniref:Uncharacterized protein n=1 Tax=Platanthera guangdongensis TaxID=2320717 RepID=A0ABR2MF00_9ASPA